MITHVKYLALLFSVCLAHTFFASEEHTFSVILSKIDSVAPFVINKTEKTKKSDGSSEETMIEYRFFDEPDTSKSYVRRDINKKEPDVVLLSTLKSRSPELFDRIEVLKKECLGKLGTKALDLLRVLNKRDLENINSVQDSDKKLPAKLYALFSEINGNRWHVTINWNGPHEEGVFEYPHDSRVSSLKKIIRKDLGAYFRKIVINKNNRPLNDDEIMPNIGIFEDPVPFSLKIEPSILMHYKIDNTIDFKFLNPPMFLNGKPIDTTFDLNIIQNDNNMIDVLSDSQQTTLSDQQYKDIINDITTYRDSKFTAQIKSDNYTNPEAEKTYLLFKKAATFWAQNTKNYLTLQEDILAGAPAQQTKKVVLTKVQPIPSVPSSVQQPWYKDLFSYDKWSMWFQRQKNNIVKNRNYIFGIFGVGTVGAYLYSQHQKGNLWQPTPPPAK